jgi:hypothetical protein
MKAEREAVERALNAFVDLNNDLSLSDAERDRRKEEYLKGTLKPELQRIIEEESAQAPERSRKR